MTIDSLRLLAGSAASLWQRLSQLGAPDLLSRRASFEEWLTAARPGLSSADEQALRRDYRRFTLLLTELEMLTRSREQALALIQDAMRHLDGDHSVGT
ncbi:MAG: hypothetical protein NZQ09_04135 [Chloroflexus sp.]|nr:hypothetical protein [Chloroflexus sp.]